MIRNRPTTSLLEQKPRKMLKLDLFDQKCYNQFEGNSQIDEEPTKTHHQTKHQQKNQPQIPNPLLIDKEINQNQIIYQLISKEHLKFRKVDDFTKQKNKQKDQQSNPHTVKKQQSLLPQLKFEEGAQPSTLKIQQKKQKPTQNNVPIQKQIKKTLKQKPKAPEPSSNWKKFIQQSKPILNQNNKGQNNNKINSKNASKNSIPHQTSRFVAMDCEFVKCGEADQLARVSIISQNGQTLYDSYIKPPTRVTDFITQITGITNSHIKNAPQWSQQVAKVKKILMNKMLVGHTLHKDLEVTKLTNWKGISQKIDIAEFSSYKEKGGSRIISLKRMALSFLNRNIQSGWHSSVQDAVATIDLFKLNKKKILKELKLI